MTRSTMMMQTVGIRLTPSASSFVIPELLVVSTAAAPAHKRMMESAIKKKTEANKKRSLFIV